MRFAKLGMIIAFGMTAAFSAVGCVDKDKQIKELTIRNNELSTQNKDLRDQLAQSKTREENLAMQLSAKQGELDTALARVRELESKPAPKAPPAAAPAEGWQRGEMGDMCTVGSDILFKSGEATLTSEGKKKLDKIASDLKSHYAGASVRVYGHTDTEPIRKTKKLWQDNLDLSANRAMAVTRYLIEKGISAKGIEAVAMGENHPVASNKDAAGRTKNRRVEIVAMRKK